MDERNAKRRSPHRTPARELLSVATAAEYLEVSERTVHRMINSGELRAYRIRKRGMIRIARVDLEALLHEVKPGDVRP
ncbi:helix-turn-helix domain-containing protein [Jiangella muralis]|uniref:helix-turn-helix domain-containing protein n=1 Tax=Jiangella muralis TaxID=702383 RepID=UPI0009F98B75